MERATELRVAIDNQEGYINHGGSPPEEQGTLAPHQAHQPKVLVPGRRTPTTFGCETQWDFWVGQKAAGNPDILLKGPHRPVRRHSPWVPIKG